MKKIINDIKNIVMEELEGMQKAYSNIIKVNYNPICITRSNIKNNKVSLISGGCSGHEPLHTGFVGHEILDAACPGEIFTSTTPDKIEEAVKYK